MNFFVFSSESDFSEGKVTNKRGKYQIKMCQNVIIFFICICFGTHFAILSVSKRAY